MDELHKASDKQRYCRSVERPRRSFVRSPGETPNVAQLTWRYHSTDPYASRALPSILRDSWSASPPSISADPYIHPSLWRRDISNTESCHVTSLPFSRLHPNLSVFLPHFTTASASQISPCAHPVLPPPYQRITTVLSGQAALGGRKLTGGTPTARRGWVRHPPGEVQS